MWELIGLGFTSLFIANIIIGNGKKFLIYFFGFPIFILGIIWPYILVGGGMFFIYKILDLIF